MSENVPLTKVEGNRQFDRSVSKRKIIFGRWPPYPGIIIGYYYTKSPRLNWTFDRMMHRSFELVGVQAINGGGKVLKIKNISVTICTSIYNNVIAHRRA